MPENRFYRGLVFCSVSLWSLLVFLIPSMVMPSDFATAEEQFAYISSSGSFSLVNGYLLQVVGAALVIPASLGIVYSLLQQKRAIVLGHIGAGVAIVGSICALVVIGMEINQIFILTHGADRAAMLEVALAINDSLLFGLFLGIGLGGIFIGNLLLMIGLLWAKVIRWWILLIFLVPLATGLLPIPVIVADILSNLAFGIVFVWTAWCMLRTSDGGVPAAHAPAPA